MGHQDKLLAVALSSVAVTGLGNAPLPHLPLSQAAPRLSAQNWRQSESRDVREFQKTVDEFAAASTRDISDDALSAYATKLINQAAKDYADMSPPNDATLYIGRRVAAEDMLLVIDPVGRTLVTFSVKTVKNKGEKAELGFTPQSVFAEQPLSTEQAAQLTVNALEGFLKSQDNVQGYFRDIESKNKGMTR